MSKSVITIPVSIATLEQLKHLLTELDIVLSSKRTKRSVSTDLQAALEENGIDSLTAQTTAQLRTAVSDLIAELPVVKVVTAQPLENTQQASIQKWFTSNIARRVILSFKTDSSLLAGVILQTPENRYDFSLQSGLVTGRALLAKRVAA